ncbi:FecCD family ABC transporter permease [Leifsonia poae]|uniref:FecCD family ABC transporter permease n=1 Tax=Leifsonia poae TaxID=110933 RepID=UPI001CBFAF6D|nr:iron chelate uptake ABC transporter family permease subunit [Leifsonia poae]
MSVDFGERQAVVRAGRTSLRIPRRLLWLCGIAATVAIAIALVSLATGSYQLSIPQVVDALLGRSSGIEATVVLDWRLPRVLLTALFGLALGLSGGIFQSLTRNPLGSPDIIGFDAGAYTGALVVMLLLHGGVFAVTGGALAGGLATAAVVYVLAWRRGVHGFRLIIVGIGVTAMLGSLNTWLLLRADLQDAISASYWGAGSLNGVGYEQLVPAALVMLILFPAVALLARPLRMLELGDDAARQLGVNAERSRLALVVVGVALSATVTALAGPIAFVALAAPQIGRRLAGAAGISLAASAATGCVLLLASDWVAQHALGGTELPVGVVTVVLGGAYFVWLLIREARNR